RVVLADDHASVREALRTAMAAEDGLSVVGLAIDGDDALRIVRTLTPDVLVLDNDMPKRSGFEVLKTVRNEWPGTSVVFFTLDEGVRDAALAAGAAAGVTKDQPLAAPVPEVPRAGARPPPGGARAGVVRAAPAAPTSS